MSESNKVEVTPEINKVILNLSGLLNVSRQEVVKLAVAILWAIKKGQANGEEPAMIKDGKIVAKLTWGN